MQAKPHLTIRQIALFGMLGALTFGAKYVMSALPNIEPVSLLVMVYAAVIGVKGLYPISIYVLLEILVYGLGPWNFNYLYIWAILFFGAYAMRKMTHPLAWAVLSAGFGLLFGLFCAPVDVVIGGFSYAAAKWVSGISFDLMHCGGNFVMALLLFVPLRQLLTKLYRKTQ